jgi:hypothetical protein
MMKIKLFLLSVFLVFALGCNKKNLPEMSTSIVQRVDNTSATGGGNITSEGESPVTERGVCWNIYDTHIAPTIADERTSDGSGPGSFTSTVTGLSSGMVYCFRAYATNSEGTGYGQDYLYTNQ